MVGKWDILTKENEKTDKASSIRKEDLSSLDQMMPYSHWYSRPLEIHEGGAQVCNSCQKMEKSSNPITISNESATLIKRSLDEDLGSADRFVLLAFLDEKFVGDITISGLDSCPYLQAGTCWWFAPKTAEGPEQLFEERPDITKNNYSFKKVIRVKKHTSKSINSNTDYNKSADHTFKERPDFGAYPGFYDQEKKPHPIMHDFVVATPTLEVGIDMSNVTEVFTHKAIRNVSSYRQKIGRGGREEGTDSIAATLLSSRTGDFLHYRSPGRLIDSELREPIPLADRNRNIVRSEAYVNF